MLQPNMPTVNDPEDARVPAGLPAVIDAHVHIFPRSMFSAVWKWFDQNGWHIRYQMTSSEVLVFLISRGIHHVIAFQYAHKPGIARGLNRYMADKCGASDHRVTGLATVYPGEPGAGRLLTEAFAAGLGGLKLHAHVQCFDMNSEVMNRLYECCRTHNKPVVMHVGREPKSTAYRCDPYKLCSAAKLARVLQDFPTLKICVPHLGFDEIAAYQDLLEKHDNLWLETTMVLADYFQLKMKIDFNRYRADRVMYGSDFPNIPYAWDRELKILKTADLAGDTLARILSKKAVDFFNLSIAPDN